MNLFLKLNKFLKQNNNLLFSTIIFIGIFLRIGNIGNNDLWYDEILSYAIASNLIDFKEFFYLSTTLEDTPILFNYLLKLFYKLVSYKPINAKFLLAFFSILSIFSTIYLSKILNKNKICLLTVFLVSFNVFLIDYATELRVYTFIYFLSTLSIIFFFKFLKKPKLLNLIFFNLFTIINSFLHPFTLIIFFSFIFFIIIKFIQKKFFLKKIIKSLIFIFVIIIIYYYFYFIFKDSFGASSWTRNLSYKFYLDYFFSNFFGSRIMGFIFLVYFVFLLFKNLKFVKNSNLLFFLILFLSSYILPLIFNFVFFPILIPRYIIFNLIPIIFLISFLIFKIKNIFIRKKIIFFIVFFVLCNSFLEAPINKIYKKSETINKPQFTKIVNHIENSQYNNYVISFSDKEFFKNNKGVKKIYEVYLNSLTDQHIEQVSFEEIKLIQNRLKKFWIICDDIINSKGCEIDLLTNYKIKKNIDLFNINLKLIEIL